VNQVYIISNQVFIREGIKGFVSSLPDFEVAGSSELIEDRLADLGRANIDIIVLDLVGLESPTTAIRNIRRSITNARIITFCPVHSSNFAVDALDAGAAGIMTHSCLPTELRIAMGRVMQGDNYIQPDIGMEIFRELRAKDTQRSEVERLRLTVREEQVINHLMQGKTNRQIGESLSISEKTVKHHVGVLKGKFCAANRLEIVVQAQRLSL
jgi:DNA-binding NarL/FixJ family response regulator